VNPRSEPLLWVQLIGLGAVPLELLLLLLLLAGGDPGPLPQLERLLTWGLGAAAPAVWLWRRPADLRSLLLIKGAMPQPTALQLRLASLQSQLVPRLLFALGVAGLLPLLNWLDGRAALASNFSPIQDGARLSSLLLAAMLLAVIVWQWQQLVQSAWLLSRTPAQLEAASDLEPERLSNERSNPGLPLLLLAPLSLEHPPTADGAQRAPLAEPMPEPGPEPGSDPEPATQPGADPEPATQAEPEPEVLTVPIAVEPEQAPEEAEGPDLDQEVD
jgi:hypothetical protein